MRKILVIFLFIYFVIFPYLSQCQQFPYSTNKDYLTIWNGREYVPFFMKGINLGIAIPGTFPGELGASRQQYWKWFEAIKQAGFNCIRLYTLHYPRFYEILDSFNNINKQNPLLFIQGIWLDEKEDDSLDLYSMTDDFIKEIEDNVSCVHGDRTIPYRQGKAYGDYIIDVSQWCLGYIIGREVYPSEIIKTNNNNYNITEYSGIHFSIKNATASEVWFTHKLDYLVEYEQKNYNTQRPVSISSWPTLDPIAHKEEQNRQEDTTYVDLSKILLNNAPAGLFISYHAYPYYPDFVSLQSDYQNYSDIYGYNSYKGYLNELKSHYKNFPLIIAEYGVPSSWGIAHYSTSGMNHGGFDEEEQGNTNIRLLNTIRTTGCGGGIQFSWIDEWFKRTWITDDIDYINESRVLWHNITSAEQNFGLVSFKNKSELKSIEEFDTISDIKELTADANYSFFELELLLKNPLDNIDDMWIVFDTYGDSIGESLLPTGVKIPFRSEFALNIKNYSATLYVTEAYDIFGIWHKTASDKQLFHSILSDGKPWYIVRWKNNSGHSDVQYIGNLKVNYDFQRESSRDGVIIGEDKIRIKIPWSLLNVVAPDKLKVFNDNRNTPIKEDTVTDGFNIGIYYKEKWYKTEKRYKWDLWNKIEDSTIYERFKTSYYIMKERLQEINTPAISYVDTFVFDNNSFPFILENGKSVLNNDFDLDGNTMISLIVEQAKNGYVEMYDNGKFVYYPSINFSETDSFRYCIFDGYSLSKPNTVVIKANYINNVENIVNNDGIEESFIITPNPAVDKIKVQSTYKFDKLFLFDNEGRLIYSEDIKDNKPIDISKYDNGSYMVVLKKDNRYYTRKFIK